MKGGRRGYIIVEIPKAILYIFTIPVGVYTDKKVNQIFLIYKEIQS
jgi:hypothetical protein